MSSATDAISKIFGGRILNEAAKMSPSERKAAARGKLDAEKGKDDNPYDRFSAEGEAWSEAYDNLMQRKEKKLKVSDRRA